MEYKQTGSEDSQITVAADFPVDEYQDKKAMTATSADGFQDGRHVVLFVSFPDVISGQVSVRRFGNKILVDWSLIVLGVAYNTLVSVEVFTIK